MDFERSIRPIDKKMSKTLLLALAIVVIAIGSVLFSTLYMMASNSVESGFYGAALVWIGGILFFYAVITEEHTMKELFIRHTYFFAGLLTMILGLFFISLSGMSGANSGMVMEFGVLVLIMGAALTLLSAQKSRDYSYRNGMIAVIAGLLMAVGGVLAGNTNVAYGGVFIVIISGAWLGLRDRFAV